MRYNAPNGMQSSTAVCVMQQGSSLFPLYRCVCAHVPSAVVDDVTDGSLWRLNSTTYSMCCVCVCVYTLWKRTRVHWPGRSMPEILFPPDARDSFCNQNKTHATETEKKVNIQIPFCLIQFHTLNSIKKEIMANYWNVDLSKFLFLLIQFHTLNSINKK
jgi:hypothetical protein